MYESGRQNWPRSLEHLSEVSSIREFGISSQVFGASEERASLQLYNAFVLIQCSFSLYMSL